jgi:hypothetical protein
MNAFVLTNVGSIIVFVKELTDFLSSNFASSVGKIAICFIFHSNRVSDTRNYWQKHAVHLVFINHSSVLMNGEN